MQMLVRAPMAPQFDSLSVYIAYPVIRIIQTVKTMTTFAAIPFEEQLSWEFLLCEVIHVQHPQQDMTTWHKKCGDDTSRPGSKNMYMGVSENRGTPKSSILIGFSPINHPFWGTTIFRNTHMYIPLDIPHSHARKVSLLHLFRSFSFSCRDPVPSKRERNEVPRLSLSMDVKIWIIHHPSSSIYIRARPTAKCSNHLRFTTWLSGFLQHEEFMHLQLCHFLAAFMISISVVSPVIFLDGVHRGPTRRHGRCLKILQELACSNCPASRAWWLHPRNML